MANSSEKSSIGMPQLDFSNFDNQTFWLFLFLILVFLVIRLLVMPRMEETLTNRRKIIEEDIQEAEELKDKALEVEKTLNNELEEARVKANDILRNCKDEIKRNTQEAIADIDIKITLENYVDNNFIYNPLDPSSNQINIDLERGKGLVKVKHDVNDSERDQIYVKVNGKSIGTLDNFNNDILVLDAGRNDIELTKGDITRKESFKVKIDDFLNWEVAFIESVEINISF